MSKFWRWDHSHALVDLLTLPVKFILLGAVEEMFARCHLLSKFQQTLLCIVWWGVCREKLGEVKKCVASTVVRKVLPGKGGEWWRKKKKKKVRKKRIENH